MKKGRVEAFSDGVIAILITIMVLELKVPLTSHWSGLWEMLPSLLCYLLSYITIGIFWNNHHHLLHACKRICASIMWVNLLLLFFLSLLPFATAWMGKNHFTREPTMFYGLVLLSSGLCYYALQTVIVWDHGKESAVARAIGRDWKGKLTLLVYFLGVVVSYFQPILGSLMYALVTLLWFIPDPRLARAWETCSQENGEVCL